MPSAPTAVEIRPAARLGGLDDLVRAQAARADAQALDAAVDHRADALEVRLEPPRRHVVRVADIAADDRALFRRFRSVSP